MWKKQIKHVDAKKISRKTQKLQIHELYRVRTRIHLKIHQNKRNKTTRSSPLFTHMHIPHHKHQEIEIKIQLHDRHDYERVAAWLREPSAIVHQHDWFFDTPERDLARSKSGMRIRFVLGAHGESESAILTHKASVNLENGISTAHEVWKHFELNIVGEYSIVCFIQYSDGCLVL